MTTKKCRECKIELTEDNKVKKELICKPCQKIKLYNYRQRIRNNEPPPPKIINEKCSICDIILTDENRLINRTCCKVCRTSKYKDYINKKTIESNNLNIEIYCSKCSTKLTPEIKVKGRNTCKPCNNKMHRESKLRNKETVKEGRKIYYEQNKEKIAEYYKENYKKNKAIYLNNNRKWRNENKDIINEQARIRCLTDENYRLRKNLRSRIHDCIKKNKPTMEYVGCDLNFLKLWFESLFTEEMTFENYGSYWHIDHVIPCSKFDLSNNDNINNCFRWTNLQPLESSKNLSKSNNIDSNEVISHYKKAKSFAKKNNINLPKFNYKNYIEIDI